MMVDTRHRIVNRAVQEIENGMNVNLGIGIPTLIANAIPADYEVLLQSENGTFLALYFIQRRVW